MKLAKITTHDGQFLIPNSDNHIKYALETDGVWEKPTLDICREYLKIDSIVIEVGSHIGSHTIPIAKICKEGVVYAFEMQRIIFNLNVTNSIINGLTNIVHFREAVSDTNELKFFKEIDYAGVYLDKDINSGGVLIQMVDKDGIIPTNLITLDNKFKFLDKLDLLKIDAEGHEVNVLKGAMELIKKHKPLILTEFDRKNQQEIIDLLPDYNFEDVSHVYDGKIKKDIINLMYKGTSK